MFSIHKRFHKETVHYLFHLYDTCARLDQFGLEHMACDWEIYYRIVYMYTSAIGPMMDNYIHWQFMHVLCYIV